MKKYYDPCQSMVALRKQHMPLLQQITSPSACWCLPLLGEDEPFSPLLPRLSGLFQPRSDVERGYREDTPAGCFTGPSSLRWPLAEWHHPLPPLCCPNKSSSVCCLTSSPAQEQHAVLWCAPAPPPLLFQPNTEPE